jgi:hypothetical protein
MLALDYVNLLAELQPAKAKTAALRWHGRLELEASTLTLAESQFALAALVALCDGNRDAIGVLRRLLRKVAADIGQRRELSREKNGGCGPHASSRCHVARGKVLASPGRVNL